MFDHDNNGNALRVRGFLRSGTAVAAILMGCIGPAFAGDSLDDSLAGLTPVSSDELSANRGGFAIGAVNVSFGFSLSTSVSGGALGSGVTVTTNFTVSSPGNLQNLGTTISGAVQKNLENAGVVDDGNPATPTLGETIAKTVDTALTNSLPNLAGASPANAATNGGAALAASAPALGDVPEPASNPVAPPPDAASSLASVVAPAVDVPAAGDIVAAVAPVVAPVVDVPAASDIVAAAASVSPASSATDTPAEAPVGDRPPAPVAIAPVLQFTAQLDQGNGSFSLSAGGTNLFLQTLQGQLALIQNTENGVQIKNSVSANYIIENYRDIAMMAGLHQQLSDLAQQLLVLQGLGHP